MTIGDLKRKPHQTAVKGRRIGAALKDLLGSDNGEFFQSLEHRCLVKISVVAPAISPFVLVRLIIPPLRLFGVGAWQIVRPGHRFARYKSLQIHRPVILQSTGRLDDLVFRATMRESICPKPDLELSPERVLERIGEQHDPKELERSQAVPRADVLKHSSSSVIVEFEWLDSRGRLNEVLQMSSTSLRNRTSCPSDVSLLESLSHQMVEQLGDVPMTSVTPLGVGAHDDVRQAVHPDDLAEPRATDDDFDVGGSADVEDWRRVLGVQIATLDTLGCHDENRGAGISDSLTD